VEIKPEEKKERLQEFYDEWIKSIGDFMPPKMLVEVEELIQLYSLRR
jgi:hypothetical protein